MTDKKTDADITPSVQNTDPATVQEERQHDEDNLDEALEETFPASDPISPSHID